MKKAKELSHSPVERSNMLVLLTVFLWLLCVGSAMGVVYSTYESRQATERLEQLRREASGLQVLSGQYLLEKSVWSNYSRIEKIAKGEMQMQKPESDKTVLVFRK